MSLSFVGIANISRIATNDRTFLEVESQEVAPRERVTAKSTHVWSIFSVCSKLDLIKDGRTYQAYVDEDGALNDLLVSKSWCSED